MKQKEIDLLGKASLDEYKIAQNYAIKKGNKYITITPLMEAVIFGINYAKNKKLKK